MNGLDRLKLANMLCVIGVVAIGCSSNTSGDVVSDPSSTEPADTASLGGAPSASPMVATDSDASGEKHTMCGSVGSGAATVPETYSFTLMNAKLVKYPSFAEGIGMRSVSTCDDARAFMKAYNEYSALNPDFDNDLPTKAALYAQWVAEGIQDPDSPVQKIFGGVLNEDIDVVEIVRATVPEENLLQKNVPCSATRLAGPLFLTSAHCLPNLTANRFKKMNIWIKRVRQDGSIGYYGNNNPIPIQGRSFLADGMHLAGYMGTNDKARDLAIVHVRPEIGGPQTEKPLSDDAAGWASGSAISTRTPLVGDREELLGWGAASEAESPSDAKLRVSDHLVQIQGVKSAWFEIPNHASNGPDSASMCAGDSGGPARLFASADGNVNGVLSGWNGIGDPTLNCTSLDVVQNWTRVDIYMGELREMVSKLQGNLRRNPYRCTFHYTGTATSPEDINAHFLCNGH